MAGGIVLTVVLVLAVLLPLFTVAAYVRGPGSRTYQYVGEFLRVRSDRSSRLWLRAIVAELLLLVVLYLGLLANVRI